MAPEVGVSGHVCPKGTEDTMKVYAAINAVGADLAKSGVAKGSKNEQQGYTFRGIEALQNALATPLAKHALCILPRVMGRQTTERVTKSGGTLLSTVLDVEFDLVHAEDGSRHTVRVVGEGMDSADKSCNKSMSAAYKYMAFLTFCVPTEASEDADSSTPEPSIPKPPAGFEEWFADVCATADEGYDPLAAAWRTSAKEFRDYTLAYRKPKWDETKKQATAVTASKKKAVQ